MRPESDEALSAEVGAAKPRIVANTGRRSTQWLLMSAVFTVSMGYGAVLPVMQSVLTRSGIPPTRALMSINTALLTGAYMLAFAASSPVWGKMADTWGRRAAVLASLAGSAVTSMAFAAPMALLAGYALRVLNGAFAAGVLPAALAHISDTSEGADRAARVGRVTAAATLGFLAGPALSGWMVGVNPLSSGVPRAAQIVAVPSLVIGFLGLAVFGACRALLPESLPAPDVAGRAAAPLMRGAGTPSRAVSLRVVRLLALSALGTFALGSFEVGSSLRAQQVLGFGPREVSLIFVGCGLIMLAIQAGLVGPALVRAGASRIVVVALLVTAAGFVLQSTASRYGTFFLAGGAIAAGTGLLVPVIAYLASQGEERVRGTTLGWQGAAAGLGQALGSGVTGLLFGLSVAAPFWITAGLLVLGVMLRPQAYSARSDRSSPGAGDPAQPAEAGVDEAEGEPGESSVQE